MEFRLIFRPEPRQLDSHFNPPATSINRTSLRRYGGVGAKSIASQYSHVAASCLAPVIGLAQHQPETSHSSGKAAIIRGFGQQHRGGFINVSEQLTLAVGGILVFQIVGFRQIRAD